MKYTTKNTLGCIGMILAYLAFIALLLFAICSCEKEEVNQPIALDGERMMTHSSIGSAFGYSGSGYYQTTMEFLDETNCKFKSNAALLLFLKNYVYLNQQYPL